jgi:hypothetical protein
LADYLNYIVTKYLQGIFATLKFRTSEFCCAFDLAPSQLKPEPALFYCEDRGSAGVMSQKTVISALYNFLEHLRMQVFLSTSRQESFLKSEKEQRHQCNEEHSKQTAKLIFRRVCIYPRKVLLYRRNFPAKAAPITEPSLFASKQ